MPVNLFIHTDIDSSKHEIQYGDHSMQQSSIGIHKIYLKRKEGGESEIEIRADNFKTIAKHKLVDTN